MSDEPNRMSCREFQDQLAELVSTGSDVESYPHLRTCDLCRSLLHDLEMIAEAARHRRFGEDGDPEPGVPAILPRGPKRGPGIAAVSFGSESE
jgi:hypothetical protein